MHDLAFMPHLEGFKVYRLRVDAARVELRVVALHRRRRRVPSVTSPPPACTVAMSGEFAATLPQDADEDVARLERSAPMSL